MAMFYSNEAHYNEVELYYFFPKLAIHIVGWSKQEKLR